jgi:hypothetical protein
MQGTFNNTVQHSSSLSLPVACPFQATSTDIYSSCTNETLICLNAPPLALGFDEHVDLLLREVSGLLSDTLV